MMQIYIMRDYSNNTNKKQKARDVTYLKNVTQNNQDFN